MIPTDNGQVQVKICDEHALNASIKSIKKAYDQKSSISNKKLIKLQKDAAALGYALIPINEKKIETTKIEVVPALQTIKPKPVKINLPPIIPASGDAPSEPGQQYNLSVKGSETIVSEATDATTVRSKTRQFTVPKKIVGNIGETTIRIIDTNDSIKHGSKEIIDKQYGGRQIHDCSVCKGMGVLSNNQNCPRCNGSGIVT